MSRVARSARVASRQRVETITSDKVIGQAESGELYLIDAGGQLDITLPTPQAGSYFKFILSDTAAGGIGITGSSSNLFIGYVKQIVGPPAGSSGATVTDPANGSSEYKLEIGSGAVEGGYVEFYSDGTKWYLSGEVSGAAATIS